jgi:hypothetical protein
LEKPVTTAALNLYLKMNHGGANSDDNENNNLGASVSLSRPRPAPAADPGAANSARIFGHSTRTADGGTDRGHLQLLAHHRSEWPSRERSALPPCGAEHPEGSLATGAGRLERTSIVRPTS